MGVEEKNNIGYVRAVLGGGCDFSQSDSRGPPEKVAFE